MRFFHLIRFESGDNAWIGASDMSEEGTFSWIGPKKMINGVPFFKNGLPIDGKKMRVKYFRSF